MSIQVIRIVSSHPFSFQSLSHCSSLLACTLHGCVPTPAKLVTYLQGRRAAGSVLIQIFCGIDPCKWYVNKFYACWVQNRMYCHLGKSERDYMTRCDLSNLHLLCCNLLHVYLLRESMIESERPNGKVKWGSWDLGPILSVFNFRIPIKIY